MTRQRDIEFSDAGAQALPADARGDPACRPPPDPQPRHHRRLALPSRSVGRAGDRRRRDGRDRDGAGAERHAPGRVRRLPGRVHDAGDRVERAGDRGALSGLAGRPCLRLRRVLAPARRLRHRVGGGAADRGRVRQDHARVGDARRHRGGAGARHRGRAGADRPARPTTSSCARPARPAANTRRSTTSTRRPPTGSISRP